MKSDDDYFDYTTEDARTRTERERPQPDLPNPCHRGARSPFWQRYDEAADAAIPWMLAMFVASLNLHALRDVIDGVSGFRDWLAVVMLTLTTTLMALFARQLIRRRRRARRTHDG